MDDLDHLHTPIRLCHILYIRPDLTSSPTLVKGTITHYPNGGPQNQGYSYLKVGVCMYAKQLKSPLYFGLDWIKSI